MHHFLTLPAAPFFCANHFLFHTVASFHHFVAIPLVLLCFIDNGVLIYIIFCQSATTGKKKGEEVCSRTQKEVKEMCRDGCMSRNGGFG
jgi:hypothetical protein